MRLPYSGKKITLQGQIRFWAERQDAERAAWTTPGVGEVRNPIAIKE